MIGTTISHYRIISHIAAGGMGTVYLAEDEHLKRRVALKFLPPDTGSNTDAAARLLREARAASALDHPNIATVYEIGRHGGQPFIAMAYYDGETLAARLARGPLPLAEAADLLAQLADALDAAHAAGVVHRDVKPSNVMLTSTGPVKVLDFGLAQTTSLDTTTRLTLAGTTVGTAAYMSPEQASGEEVDQRTDLWALGVVTYEMLAGVLPFKGANALSTIHAVLTATPAPIRMLRPDVAAELEAVVSRTLVRDRESRTISAGEVRGLAAACRERLAGRAAPAAAAHHARRWWIAAAIAAVALAGGGVWRVERNTRVTWARREALPEIVRLAGADRFDEAYRLAERAEPDLRDDPIFAEQLRTIARPATIVSDPPGAAVFYRPYGHERAAWRPLGKAPVHARLPYGVLHYKAEMAGRESAEDVGPFQFDDEARIFLPLVPAGQAPAGMVRIASPDRTWGLHVAGLDHLPDVHLPDYWIDRYEVTNRAYKRFVDDNGYRRAELWREPFARDDGRLMTFSEAMALFRDATGQPGPAAWEMGNYAAGQDEYPVAGVSWYEAAAYARWAGKSLPTLYHWTRAADPRLSAEVVPASNVGGKALLPVGAAAGITRGGTRDMAGNVKEWCLNATGGRRYIAGGAWNEPTYMFNDADFLSPWARSATLGFRCIKVDRPGDLSGALTAPIAVPAKDPRRAKPVSEAVFQTWRTLLYSSDRGALDARTESINEASREWRVEKVSYAAAYGEERIPAYLFLPGNAKPPYQVMLAFPGSGGFYERSASSSDFDAFTFLVRSGRALLFPVYKSTFERADSLRDDYPNTSKAWRDHMIMWVKDVSRSLDYLHSRRDIASDKVGFIGQSWGGMMAPVVLAVEPRFSLAVLYCGGFALQPSLPEVDPVNFASRVTVPVLMLNGQYDYFYPTAISQEPLFALLGTPPAHKRRVVYETSHAIPRTETVKEVVRWMDKYWGEPAR